MRMNRVAKQTYPLVGGPMQGKEVELEKDQYGWLLEVAETPHSFYNYIRTARDPDWMTYAGIISIDELAMLYGIDNKELIEKAKAAKGVESFNTLIGLQV